MATTASRQRTMTVHRSQTPAGLTLVSLTIHDGDEDDDYTVFHNVLSDRVLWRHDGDNRREYEVTIRGRHVVACTCPHWTHRGRKSGALCRHMSATHHLIQRHHLPGV